MENDDDKHAVGDLRRELSELGEALRPFARRFPGMKKATDRLIACGADLAEAGLKALESR